MEVLQHNTGAVSVYKKIGFEVSREFYYFRSETHSIKNESKTLNFLYTLQPIDINKYNLIPTFWDFKPSWQNSIESINRAPEGFVSLGVFINNALVGYSVFEPVTGDLTQIAVDKQYRRRGIGSLLFASMIEKNKAESIKIINTDITCNSVTGFLRSKNIQPTGKQFEMIKKLE